MRIGIDARRLSDTEPAGIGTYVRRLIDVFQNLDKENDYYLYSSRPLDSSVKLNKNFHSIVSNKLVGTLWIRYGLRKQLIKDRIDVFWGPEHILPRKVKGIKYILTIHDLALLKNPRWGQRYNAMIQNLFVRRSINCADQIITISESTKRDIIELTNYNANKIKVIYIGADVNTQSISESQKEQILRNNHIVKPYFLYLGTIEPRKNITTILKAFERVNQNNRYQLVLAGKLGWKYKEIVNTIHESNCREDIKYLGYVSNEEKAALYSGCLAFVFVSHYEGFGIPIIEAMSYGTTVITSSNSSLPEVAGNAAFIIKDENNAEELADMMNKCINLQSADRDLLTNRMLLQIKKISWKVCANSTLNTIKELVNK